MERNQMSTDDNTVDNNNAYDDNTITLYDSIFLSWYNNEEQNFKI